MKKSESQKQKALIHKLVLLMVEANTLGLHKTKVDLNLALNTAGWEVAALAKKKETA